MEPTGLLAYLGRPHAGPQARSALPDAPVVPHAATVSIIDRLRTALRAARTAFGKGNGAATWHESPCRPSPTVSA
jgi:hypothetical protein